MFNWLKQRKINALLADVAHDKAYLKALDECHETDAYVAGRLAETEEKLRQLGYASLSGKIRTSAFPPVTSDAEIEEMVAGLALAIKLGNDPLIAEIWDHLRDYGVDVKRDPGGSLKWTRIAIVKDCKFTSSPDVGITIGSMEGKHNG